MHKDQYFFFDFICNAFPCSRHPYVHTLYFKNPPLETRIAASKVFADQALSLPPPPSPGAVLTTLDRCPLNIDFALKDLLIKLSLPVSSSQLPTRPQRIIVKCVCVCVCCVKRTFFYPAVYQKTFGKFELNSFVHTRQEQRSSETWRHCHEQGFWTCKSNIL